jgi:hypothetical protein
MGAEYQHQEGDIVMLYQAGEAEIVRIQNPRTATKLTSEAVKPARAVGPKWHPKAQDARDWIGELIGDSREEYINDNTDFRQTTDTTKMIHVVTD